MIDNTALIVLSHRQASKRTWTVCGTDPAETNKQKDTFQRIVEGECLAGSVVGIFFFFFLRIIHACQVHSPGFSGKWKPFSMRGVYFKEIAVEVDVDGFHICLPSKPCEGHTGWCRSRPGSVWEASRLLWGHGLLFCEDLQLIGLGLSML